MADVHPALESVIARARESAKYRDVSESLVRRIAAAELAKGAAERVVIKAVKRRLHQVAGVFFALNPRYADWLSELRAAAREGDVELRRCLRGVMASHGSSKERLPFLERFYTRILADAGPVVNVLDLACGMNPLAAPWMGLAPGARYVATDVYGGLMDFVREALALLGLAGAASVCDICGPASVPPERFDVAFLLKSVPCLMHLDGDCPRRLISAVNARELVLSFPAKSLGGREKGMRTHYENVLRRLLSGTDWPVRTFEFPNETVFRISKTTSVPGNGTADA